MTERLPLWEEHRDVAMLALWHLLDDDEELSEEPIAIVADTSDPTTLTFAEALQGAIEAEDSEAIVVESDENLLVFVVPVELVRRVTHRANPECWSALADTPPDQLMWAAIASDGGMTLLHVPIEPFRVIGEA